MVARRWCGYGGSVITFSKDHKGMGHLYCEPRDSEGRVVCPGCSRKVKLRRHPMTSRMWVLPRHKVEACSARGGRVNGP
jgi:hypothetical protein